MFDFASHIKSDQVLTPQVATADKTSTAVDLLQYGLCRIAGLIGVSGDTLSTSVKIELEVQESADNSTFTAVADTDLSAPVAGTNPGTFAIIDGAADDDAQYQVEYRGKLRYVRAVANFTGTHTNGTPLAFQIDRGMAKELPVS